jgi:hypothetical protein
MRNDSLIISGILGLLLLSSSNRKREVTIVGFMYPKEHVEVSFDGKKWSPVNSNMTPQPYNLLAFYEQRKIDVSNKEFRAKVDSAGIVLLDTLLLISKNNKSPLISFISPLETMPKRAVFTADDDTLLKY